MSKGTPRISLRLSPLHRAMIERYVRERNVRHPKKPWTVTTFIVTAIFEKLHNLNRSPKYRRKKDDSTADNGSAASTDPYPTVGPDSGPLLDWKNE